LTGFSKQLGQGLHQMLEGSRPGWLSEGWSLSVDLRAGGLLSLLRALHQTVYWYLFNDVVPPVLLGRFLSLFR